MPSQKSMVRRIQRERVDASFLPKVWCQFEKAEEKRRKTNDANEGWNRAINRNLGFVNPTIVNFIDLLKRKKSATED